MSASSRRARRAAVRQPGEVVGQRLAAGLAELADLAEGHRRARDREHDGRGGERHGDLVLLAEGRRREHADGDERRDRRDRERPPFADAGVAVGQRLPRGERDDEERDRPDGVEPGALDVGVVGGLDEVDRVRDAVAEQPEAEERPGAARTPAGHAEHAHDRRDQQQVADRVGEVDRDDERLAAGVGDQDVVGDRGAEGGGGEARDEAVEPRAAVEVARAAADEGHQRDPAQRVEAEPQRVGERDVRDVAVGVDDAEADVAHRVGGERGGERRPRPALGRHEDRPGGAQGGGPGVGGAAHPGLPERDRAGTAGHPGQDRDRVDGDDRDGRGEHGLDPARGVAQGQRAGFEVGGRTGHPPTVIAGRWVSLSGEGHCARNA